MNCCEMRSKVYLTSSIITTSHHNITTQQQHNIFTKLPSSSSQKMHFFFINLFFFVLFTHFAFPFRVVLAHSYQPLHSAFLSFSYMTSLEMQRRPIALKAGWNNFRKMKLYSRANGKVSLSLGPHW